MTINDLNHAPVIEEGQEFELLEVPVEGLTVGIVRASDPDLDQTLVYSIVNGNTDGAFEIQEELGIISIANAAAISFDTNPVFSLSIEVADSTGTPLTATETVVVSLVQFVTGTPATEAGVVATLNDVFDKMIQLRDVGGTLDSGGYSYAPLTPGSTGSSIGAAQFLLTDMSNISASMYYAALGKDWVQFGEDLSAYETDIFDLGLAISAISATTNEIVGLGYTAMAWSEGDQVRIDGIRSVLGSIEDMIGGIRGALFQERIEMGEVADASLSANAYCFYLTEGSMLGLLDSLAGSLAAVTGPENELIYPPISGATGDLIDDVNEQQEIVAAVDFSYVLFLANTMLTYGQAMLNSYNDSTGGYSAFYAARANYYAAEDAMLGGTTAAQFGSMGVLLTQIKNAIQADAAALALEDGTAYNDPNLNDGTTDQLRRYGIQSHLEWMQSNLDSVTDLLALICNQVDAISTAVDGAGRWYMFDFPDPYSAVVDECNRAYSGFVDGGIAVKGIADYHFDIEEMLFWDFGIV